MKNKILTTVLMLAFFPFYRRVELLESEDGSANFVVAPAVKNASPSTERRQHSNSL